jgi:electron transport complex protein RnfG
MQISQHFKSNYLVQAWLVLALAGFFGAALAGVQLTLEPTIADNKLNEIRQKVPELVLESNMAQKTDQAERNLSIEPQTIKIEKEGKNATYNVFEAKYPNKILAGWVVKTTGQGYGDKIEILLGIDPSAGSITGIFVLDQKETPGLGSNIITPEWRKQFVKKDTSRPLVVVKGGAAKDSNEIDAITGATISSRSVCQIINTALSDLRDPLAAKALKTK